MPFDETGAYVPTLQPPSAAQLGVAGGNGAPSALPLDPLAVEASGVNDPNSPNSRPVVTSPTADVPAFAGGGMPVPVAPGAPVQPSQAMPPTGAPAPIAPVIPIRRTPGAAPAPAGGGIPGSLDAMDKQIAADQKTEADATQNAADVEATGLAKVADEKTRLAGEQRDQAAELAAQQLYARDRQAELNEMDRQNLEEARTKTIPDFWSGREGAHVGASIGVLLAGIGAGFLGSTQNQAAEVIQHNTDKYFDRKKEEIDNLYKYASAQGLVNDKARDQYAKSITDLMQQHAAVLDAARSRVEAVTAESQSDDAKARGAVLASQLATAAQKEHLGVTDARIKWYDAQDANKAKLMDARANMIRATTERTKAAVGGEGKDEKADLAAFQGYVKGPHGKEADEINRRVEALNSAHQGVAEAKSIGEVVAQVDKAIAADAGAGTRGVSMGQLHSILPNLVSASGEISNKVSQNWDGSAGKEFKAAAARMIDTARQGRLAERKEKAANLEKNLALIPHAQKNPAFAHTSALQLYPELGSSAAPAPSQATGPAEGSTATSGGKPIIFKGGKWVPNG